MSLWLIVYANVGAVNDFSPMLASSVASQLQ